MAAQWNGERFREMGSHKWELMKWNRHIRGISFAEWLPIGREWEFVIKIAMANFFYMHSKWMHELHECLSQSVECTCFVRINMAYYIFIMVAEFRSACIAFCLWANARVLFLLFLLLSSHPHYLSVHCFLPTVDDVFKCCWWQRNHSTPPIAE